MKGNNTPSKKTNPDIHMICGKCGCATMLSFRFSMEGNDNGEYIYPSISIHCDNCSTLTGLDEIIQDKTDWQKLKLIKNY
jgi:hypothetical protein